MRVLLLTQYFWPENFMINQLVTALNEAGVEMDVLTGMPNYPAGRFFPGYGGLRCRSEEYCGSPVHRVPHLARGTSVLGLGLNYVSFPVSAAFFGRRLRNRGYDAILAYAPSPATVGMAALHLKRSFGGIPLLYWVQDLWPESVADVGGIRSPIVLAPLENMVRRIYRGSDMILVSSRAFEPAVIARGVDAGKIRYIPNTVDSFYLPQDRPKETPEQNELPKDGFRIVFGGNIGEAQRIETALNAAAALRERRDIHWIFIGEGRRSEQARQYATSLGLDETVHFLGRREPRRMPSYYALADALLITLGSGGILDATVPSKLQAYLASGRPILGAINGEGARIIRDAEAGICVPAGDAVQLGRAAVRLRGSSEEEQAAMSRAARKYFEREFSLEEVSRRLFAALREAKKMTA